MKDFAQQYAIAKQRALQMMQVGNIAAYIAALSEMNQYKRMMNAITLN